MKIPAGSPKIKTGVRGRPWFTGIGDLTWVGDPVGSPSHNRPLTVPTKSCEMYCKSFQLLLERTIRETNSMLCSNFHLGWENRTPLRVCCWLAERRRARYLSKLTNLYVQHRSFFGRCLFYGFDYSIYKPRKPFFQAKHALYTPGLDENRGSALHSTIQISQIRPRQVSAKRVKPEK